MEDAGAGVLVVDKPAGPTSHDVVDAVRKALGLRRVGHTGTLDPFATGVLPVCLGRATRLARFLGEGDKVYRATVRLGFATTTDDATGAPLGEPRPFRGDQEAIASALQALTGTFAQVPPAYSARRVGGRRLYELARRGEAVPGRARPVTVRALTLLGASGETLDIEVRCTPGTYVRALARDLGTSLGVGGHLTALRRLRSGDFGLEEAVSLESLAKEGRARAIPMARLLPHVPAVHVGAEGEAAVRHGRGLNRGLVIAGFPTAGEARFRVLSAEDGRLLALAVPRGFGAPVAGLPMEPVLQPDVVLVG